MVPYGVKTIWFSLGYHLDPIASYGMCTIWYHMVSKPYGPASGTIWYHMVFLPYGFCRKYTHNTVYIYIPIRLIFP